MIKEYYYIKIRAGQYIKFVRYIDIFFISDTVWSNTVIDIQRFDTSASGNKSREDRLTCRGESA